MSFGLLESAPAPRCSRARGRLLVTLLVLLCVMLGLTPAFAQDEDSKSRGGSIASPSLLERDEDEVDEVLPDGQTPWVKRGPGDTRPDPEAETEAEPVEEYEAPERKPGEWVKRFPGDTPPKVEKKPSQRNVQELVFEDNDAAPVIRQADESEDSDTSTGDHEAAPALRNLPPPPAAASTGPAGTVTNFFFDTDIREAVNEMSQQGGKRVIVAPEVDGIVTMSFNQIPLREALELMITGTGYMLIETPDYFIIASREVDSTSFIDLSETRLISLDYLDAKTAVTLLAKPLQEYVSADNERNLLSISAPPQVMERIAKDVATLDAAPRQMVLETRIVVMESEDVMNLGLEWEGPTAVAGALSNSNLHGGLAPTLGNSWPWAVQLGLNAENEFTDSLNVRLNMMAANDQITVLANLHVLALDGEEAEVSVTTEEYFEILSQGLYSQSQLEQVEAGTIMKMTPRVSENGDVKLSISTEVSDVVSRGENDLPVVTRRLASSSVRVKDGGTVVVAGLTDDRNRDNYRKVPGLGDIPGLSSAFRNTGRDRRTRQILVFVTPRLMKTGEPGEELIAKKNIALVDEELFRGELLQAISRLHSRNAMAETSADTTVPSNLPPQPDAGLVEAVPIPMDSKLEPMPPIPSEPAPVQKSDAGQPPSSVSTAVLPPEPDNSDPEQALAPKAEAVSQGRSAGNFNWKQAQGTEQIRRIGLRMPRQARTQASPDLDAMAVLQPSDFSALDTKVGIVEAQS